MWHVKLNRPVAYEWAPHMPKIPIPKTHQIQHEVSRVTETIPLSTAPIPPAT